MLPHKAQEKAGNFHHLIRRDTPDLGPKVEENKISPFIQELLHTNSSVRVITDDDPYQIGAVTLKRKP